MRNVNIATTGKATAVARSTIQRWEVDSGDPLADLAVCFPSDNSARPLSSVNSPLWLRALAISPDGQTLAYGGNDRTITLWHVP